MTQTTAHQGNGKNLSADAAAPTAPEATAPFSDRVTRAVAYFETLTPESVARLGEFYAPRLASLTRSTT
jgi:hypothetical protein